MDTLALFIRESIHLVKGSKDKAGIYDGSF